MEEKELVKIESIKVQVMTIKEYSCYVNEKLALHQACPYGKTKIDNACLICVRKQEEILQTRADIIDESKIIKPNN